MDNHVNASVRELQLLQIIAEAYATIQAGIGDIRDNYCDKYFLAPGSALGTTLGKLSDISYHLSHIDQAIKYFFYSHPGMDLPYQDYKNRDEYITNELSRLAQKHISSKVKEVVACLIRENRRLKTENRENGRLKSENSSIKSKYESYREGARTTVQRLLSRCEVLEAERAALQRDNEELQSQVRRYRQRIRVLEVGIYVEARQPGDAASLQARIAKLQSTGKALAVKYTAKRKEAREQGDVVKRLQAENEALAARCQALREQAREMASAQASALEAKRREAEAKAAELGAQGAAKDRKIQELLDIIADLERGQERPRATAEPAYFIERFAIAPAPALLVGSSEKMVAEVERAAHMEEILDYLNSSGNASIQPFRRQIEKCAQKLQNLAVQIPDMAADGESLSEKATLKFFKIIAANVLNTVLGGITRGYDQDRIFYQGLLTKINKWLQSCGIYTRMVLPGRKMDDKDYEDMTLVTKASDDLRKHGIISSVERLPYYMDYIDESGDRAWYYHEGCLTLFTCNIDRDNTNNG